MFLHSFFCFLRSLPCIYLYDSFFSSLLWLLLFYFSCACVRSFRLFVDFCNLFFVLCFARARTVEQRVFFLSPLLCFSSYFAYLNRIEFVVLFRHATSFAVYVFAVLPLFCGEAKTKQRPSRWPVFQGWSNGATNIYIDSLLLELDVGVFVRAVVFIV